MKAFSIFVIAVATFAAGVALAETDASSKLNGSASDAYCGWSGGMYQSHAFDHAAVLRDYAETGEQVPRDVTRENAQAIRENIEAARRAYSSLRNSTGESDDTATKQFGAVEEQLNKALELCEKLDAESAKPQGDSATISDCCAKITEALKAAQAEHQKLLLSLTTRKSDSTGTTSETSTVPSTSKTPASPAIPNATTTPTQN